MAMLSDIRWRQVSRLLDEVLVLASEERKAHLESACGDDVALCREVEMGFSPVQGVPIMNFDTPTWIKTVRVGIAHALPNLMVKIH